MLLKCNSASNLFFQCSAASNLKDDQEIYCQYEELVSLTTDAAPCGCVFSKLLKLELLCSYQLSASSIASCCPILKVLLLTPNVPDCEIHVVDFIAALQIFKSMQRLEHLELPFYVIDPFSCTVADFSFPIIRNLYLPGTLLSMHVFVSVLQKLPQLLHFTTLRYTIDIPRFHLRIEGPHHTWCSALKLQWNQDIHYLLNLQP